MPRTAGRARRGLRTAAEASACAAAGNAAPVILPETQGKLEGVPETAAELLWLFAALKRKEHVAVVTLYVDVFLGRVITVEVKPALLELWREKTVIVLPQHDGWSGSALVKWVAKNGCLVTDRKDRLLPGQLSKSLRHAHQGIEEEA